MDIAEWLRGLGLSQYEASFRDNAIELEILPELTEADLEKLGVLLGHRKRILRAVAALGPAESPPRAVAPTPEEAAERRQLTVMFCDLVGSTALATRLDPEDLREVIGDYHRAVADTVGRFGGFVAKYMGDGVLVYFGYPEAHEDDAERAVRAGLAVIEAVGRLPAPEGSQARIGVATGLVVVGDLIGSGAAQERGVVGETPNLAARLQALADPGNLVVADGTRRQIGGLFEVEDLGPRALAGFAKPQRAWRVLGESGEVSRFEALRSAATLLVGRDEELELLLRRWRQARAGQGRVVLISGEPGIGKSRLAIALHERIAAEPHTRLRYFCSPHHQDSALHPVIVQLERAAGFARDDTAARKLGKLQALLASGAQGEDDIALIAELLSLPNSAADLNLSPQRKREKLFEALLKQLEARARQQPVLMVFEDLQWIDPTSRELLDLLVDNVRRLPVGLLLTFRPEFEPPWTGQPHVATMTLNRLGERDGAALVDNLAGNAALDEAVVAEIVERTDGVPLFVEELTKAVLETADRENRVATVLAASPAASLAIPASLHASLIARLDRLGTAAREVAQIGAVLGREFSYELVRQVAGRADLDAALGRLADAGLLFCRGVAPHSSYLFKHALVQDAAYGTLLRGRRQEWHARVAAVLGEKFADLVERQPELLAHHLTGAGDAERAGNQWLEAGKHAAARSTHLEAIGHFARGLAVLASLPETSRRDRCEVELQLGRGISLLTAKGFTCAEAVEPFARAKELCEKSGDADHLFVALWNLWLTTANRDLEAARGLSNRLLILTERQEDGALRLEAHHSAWYTCFAAGEPAAARRHCEEGRRIYDFERHRLLGLSYGGHDPGVCARQWGALVEWLLGYPDTAIASIRDGMQLAERLHHPLTLEHALFNEAVLHLFRREPDMALQRATEAAALAAEQRLALLWDPDILRGSALLAQGAVEPAVASIRTGLAARDVTGWPRARQYFMTLVSEVLECVGDHDGAFAALADAEVTTKAPGEHWWEAEIHRLRGVLLLSRRCVAESAACFERSIQIARRQQAKSLELRAATGLARLWGEQGRRAQAHKLLAPVYGWFTEGFGTADLKEAKALLDELA